MGRLILTVCQIHLLSPAISYHISRVFSPKNITPTVLLFSLDSSELSQNLDAILTDWAIHVYMACSTCDVLRTIRIFWIDLGIFRENYCLASIFRRYLKITRYLLNVKFHQGYNFIDDKLLTYSVVTLSDTSNGTEPPNELFTNYV